MSLKQCRASFGSIGRSLTFRDVCYPQRNAKMTKGFCRLLLPVMDISIEVYTLNLSYIIHFMFAFGIVTATAYL